MIELDFVRGVAILLVLVQHYSTSELPILRLLAPGGLGVDMFFVLSGFLVGGLLLKEWSKTKKIDGFRFLKRRAFKIWPAYYFYILFAIVFHTHPYNTFVVGNLLNIQNYTGTSMGHTWTLAVEEHFYILLTLFMIFASAMNWTPKSVLITLISVAFCVFTIRNTLFFLGHRNLGTITYTHTRMDSLIYGVILATTFNFWPKAFAAMQKHRILLCAVMAISFFLVSAKWRGNIYFSLTFMDFGCAAFLLLVFRPVTVVNRNWLYRTVAFIGVYSYGIYLWHLACGGQARALAHYLPQWLAPWFFALAPYPAAILFGVFITKAIEFPFLRLREKLVPSPHGSHLLPDPASPKEPDRAW